MSDTRQTKRLTIGYARVSTDKQADSGGSLLAQAAKLNAMAILRDVHLAEIVSDAGESAKDMDRPGLQRVLSLCDSGKVETVIVSKLDRLTRSVRDLADLLELFERRKVSLVSVSESLDTGSSHGKLILNIMTAVSQWEREAIGERTSVVLQHKRAGRQVYTRHDPYGFMRRGDELVPVETEQRVVERVRGWRDKGWSLRRIAAALEADGIPAKQGTRWHAKVLKGILENPLHKAA